MKTSEAKTLIQGMVKDGKLSYDSNKGLLLTEKAAGIALESLAELSTEQVSRIGEEFDSLFETRKRVSSLLKNGVSADTLRTLLAEIEGKTATGEAVPVLNGTEPKEGTGDNAEEDNSQLLLPGGEAESEPSGIDTTQNDSAAETATDGGENSTTDNIRQSVNGGGNTGTQNRSRRNYAGGTV